jgi:hypothetical protein
MSSTLVILDLPTDGSDFEGSEFTIDTLDHFRCRFWRSDKIMNAVGNGRAGAIIN